MDNLKSRDKSINYVAKAFMTGLCLSFLVFIPLIIRDGGLFLYYGDFNVQQVPFYQIAHDAVRRGSIAWNQYTDLGANFIGSYSFYLLGSPFFWLTIPFNNEFLPYLMGPLLMLKFASATTTSYVFLKRYVKNKDIAIIGGILYAFSGFSVYNVFFNHFHEAIIIFPLLLWAMDEYVEKRRRGIFAICVAMSCIFNYYFFVGQVTFCVLYFLLRVIMGSYKISIRDFLLLILESVIGLGISAFLLIPSIYTLIENSRVSNPIEGWDALLYDRTQRYVHILQSMFFPPDLPARPNFTPDSGSKWSSLGAWLPLFGMTGTIAWLQQKRRHWLKRLIVILLFCTAIPVLNSSFQLFNASYYARWFYMLTLIFCLATVMSLESVKTNWRKAIKTSTIFIVAITVAIGFMPKLEKVDGEEVLSFGLMDYPTRFWSYVAIALLSTAILVFILKYSKKEKFARNCLIGTCCVSVVFSLYILALAKSQTEDPYKHIIPYAINGGDDVKIDDLENVRSDFYESLDNSGMFWKIPNIQAFHSIVPTSIIEFYEYIDVNRDVASRPETNHYALRGLTSVKYLFDDDDDSDYFGGENYDDPEISGFVYYGNSDGFDIWENQYYVPMGFNYSGYILRSEADELSYLARENSMMNAVIIEDEDEIYVSSILEKIDPKEIMISQEAYVQDCIDRSQKTCSNFEYNQSGFDAYYSSTESELVFFSVPYEKGWSATVNGQNVDILKTNIGFMSVIVPKGTESKIVFKYETTGLNIGVIITLSSVVLLLLYRFMTKNLKQKNKSNRNIYRRRKLGSFKEYCKKMKINVPVK